jgi:hypothetical protein
MVVLCVVCTAESHLKYKLYCFVASCYMLGKSDGPFNLLNTRTSK